MTLVVPPCFVGIWQPQRGQGGGDSVDGAMWSKFLFRGSVVGRFKGSITFKIMMEDGP